MDGGGTLRAILACLTSAWLLSACGSDSGDLEEARERWKKSGIEHYELYAMECAWGECTGELRVVVDENGVTAERTPPHPNDNSFDPKDFTVEAYFDSVERSIGRGDLANVSYDDELGYVWVLSIDGESNEVITAHGFKRL
jgi:hypothetical protein